MGSPEFAIPSLEKLHASGHTIKAVVSNVDKRRGRGSELHPTPLKARALELGLPVIGVEDLKSEAFEKELSELNADLFVVVAFRILPPNILAVPKIGSVNLHASLLPRYRGAAPIHRAVMNGDSETGCSVFFLDQKVDTGNIILQKSTPIGPLETTGEVYNRLKEEGSDVLLEAVNMIESGSYELTEQDDSLASPAPKLFKEDCHVDFSRPAGEVHNMIRGLSPFPTAWAEWNGEKFNMYHSAPDGPQRYDMEPGSLFENEGKLYAACGSGSVELKQVQVPGSRKMSGSDFLNGHKAEGRLS